MDQESRDSQAQLPIRLMMKKRLMIQVIILKLNHKKKNTFTKDQIKRLFVTLLSLLRISFINYCSWHL